MSNPEMKPGEYDAILGNQVSPPIRGAVLGGLAGVKSRLALPNNAVTLATKISTVSEACKYGEVGFDLVIELMRDESIDPKLKTAGQLAISLMLAENLVTDDLGWYLVNEYEPFTESKTDTLKLACDKLLDYIELLDGKRKWYLDGGISYIFLSPIQDWEWIQGIREPLSRPLKYLVQILSAEKLRRVRVLYFIKYSHIYYDIREVYRQGILEGRFKKTLESKLLNRSVYYSLLPMFEEYLEALKSGDENYGNLDG